MDRLNNHADHVNASREFLKLVLQLIAKIVGETFLTLPEYVEQCGVGEIPSKQPARERAHQSLGISDRIDSIAGRLIRQADAIKDPQIDIDDLETLLAARLTGDEITGFKWVR